MSNLNDIIGYVAAVCSTCSFVPQAYRVYKTQKTDDLSPGMYLLSFLGTISWGTYGFLTNSPPVLYTNIVVSILALYILVMIMRNLGCRKERAESND